VERTLVCREFRPGLWLTELALPDFGVRGAVIQGEQRTVVWDTLSHPADMAALPEGLAGRTPVIVYSHADWDHVWGTAGLADGWALIVGQDLCRMRFADDVPLTLAKKRQEELGDWDAVDLIAPDVTFATAMTLDLGGLTLELQALPGHTADCIVGFLPEWGILLAGDTVETPLPVTHGDSPLGAWIHALEAWQTDPRVRTVIPAHGIIGGPEVIGRTVAYLRQLAEGRPFTVADELDDFYRMTHAANQGHFAKNPVP
jgi:glyoxylase-like metal-dependent hydrolase (beta-lactamase superfamily II)